MDRNFPRLMQTLRLIPLKQRATAAEIQQQLESLGFCVSRRTVERDLESLAAHYDIDCDSRTRPFGWRWATNGKTPFMPGMDQAQALALLMMDRELGDLMPSTAREALNPWIAEAKRTAQRSGHNRASGWIKKIAFKPLGPPLLPAKVSPAVMECFSQALFQEVQVECEYRSTQQDDYRKIRLHPLGLVRTGLVTYLVACFDGYDDPRLLALHRVRRVQRRVEKINAPKGFDLETYLHQGALNFGTGKMIDLKISLPTPLAAHLRETPLSEDQILSVDPSSSDRVIVCATVEDSPRLEWWLQGFGSEVQLLNDK